MTMDVCNLTDSHDVKPEILCALFVKLSFCKLNLSKTEVNSMQNIWKTDILSSLVKANYFKHFWTWVKFGANMTMDLYATLRTVIVNDFKLFIPKIKFEVKMGRWTYATPWRVSVYIVHSMHSIWKTDILLFSINLGTAQVTISLKYMLIISNNFGD